MTRYFFRVLRALVISCVGFGSGVGMLVLIVLVIKGDPNAFQHGLNAGMAIGLVFAILLLGVLLPMDFTAHMFSGKGHYKQIWELEQKREIDLTGSQKDVMTRCRLALLQVPDVKAVSDDAQAMIITAKIGPSWRSTGESMTVKMDSENDNQWHVVCISKSESEHVLFDYAKNSENVDQWLNALNKPSYS